VPIPLADAGVPTVGERTLTAYRRRAAQEIGPFHVSTATGGSTTAVLKDSQWPVKNMSDVSDLYVDQFIYRPNAGVNDRERGIRLYDPSAGLLTPDVAYGVAPVLGEVYEIHGVIRPAKLHEHINAALKRIPLVVEFSFNPTSSTDRRHSLATVAPWLRSEDWVYGVGCLGSRLDRNKYTPSRVYGEAVRDGGTVYLDIGCFDTSDTLYVTALKPAYYHCRPAGGAFGDQAGLVLEDDEAVPVEELVAYGAASAAWLGLVHELGDDGARRVAKDLSLADQQFVSEARNFFREPDRTFFKRKHWGPRR
jgi:hypothetical protein